MALESELRVSPKLRDCEMYDKDHVGEAYANTGPHVALIKRALNAWARKNGIPEIPETELFDKVTGDFVERYKREHKPKPILNYKGKIDRIVGIKTIRALDKELPKVAPFPMLRRVFDVVVDLTGGRELGELKQMRVVQPKVRAAYDAKNLTRDRALIELAQVTAGLATMKDGAKAIVDRAVAEIGAEAAGKIMVYGSSSGGQWAMAVAAEFNSRNLPVDYLAVMDPPWFANQATNKPTGSKPGSATDEPKETPIFHPPFGASAHVRKNFFQTKGNRWKRTLNHGFMFTSKMDNEEIHGNIVGFDIRDMSLKLTAGDPDGLHSECIRVSRREINVDIENILTAI